MLSEDAQNRIISDGQDLLSYSQDVELHLTQYMKDVKPVIEENHMYIRIASNDFFSISCKAVSCCNQHIRPIYTAQSVCHNRIGFIASAGMETIGISFL